MASRFRAEIDSVFDMAAPMEKSPVLRILPSCWDKYIGGRYKPEFEVATAVADETLRLLTEKLTSYPDGFSIHPKVKKLLEQRAKMGTGKVPLDYGMAESLAFVALLLHEVSSRVS